jgi:hypothetical protein
MRLCRVLARCNASEEPDQLIEQALGGRRDGRLAIGARLAGTRLV